MSASRSFFDAVGGWRRTVAISDSVQCMECQGTGLSSSEDDAPPCMHCDGTGMWEGVDE